MNPMITYCIWFMREYSSLLVKYTANWVVPLQTLNLPSKQVRRKSPYSTKDEGVVLDKSTSTRVKPFRIGTAPYLMTIRRLALKTEVALE